MYKRQILTSSQLAELRDPAINVNGITGPAGAPDGSNPLVGILGSLLGESAAQQKSRIEEATKSANDLTGMVRKKKPEAAAAKPAEATTKRKLEEDGEEAGNGKKTKL